MTDQQPSKQQIGILLTNVGTPAAPTAKAVRPYLKEFLSDPRIVDYPRWLWLPLLHGIILNTRPARSARLYQNIWKPEGPPLLSIMEAQAKQLSAYLHEKITQSVQVEIGLRYGQPSINQALETFKKQGIQKLLVFPLFPQFSVSTTLSSFDAVFDEIRSWWWVPELRTIQQYHNHPGYIQSLVNNIQEFWQTHPQPEKLLFSFHGIPQRYAENGDPYPEQCYETARLVARSLNLPDEQWGLSFQSRFGPEAWLKPYTDMTLEAWGKEGIKTVHVIAPGFSADCLETIDELGREARESFEEAGGDHLHYIPALNNRPDHIRALGELILSHIKQWH